MNVQLTRPDRHIPIAYHHVWTSPASVPRGFMVSFVRRRRWWEGAAWETLAAMALPAQTRPLALPARAHLASRGPCADGPSTTVSWSPVRTVRLVSQACTGPISAPAPLATRGRTVLTCCLGVTPAHVPMEVDAGKQMGGDILWLPAQPVSLSCYTSLFY